jgi:hypothetical protein
VLVKIKKSFVFLRWHVEQSENVLVKACTDVEMLEDSSLSRETRWLRLFISQPENLLGYPSTWKMKYRAQQISFSAHKSSTYEPLISVEMDG